MPRTNLGEIRRLVEKHHGLGEKARRRYSEAQTRKDFIDPLFSALGWDIRGVRRDEVRVEERTPEGTPDYTFLVDGVPRFYVEAKALDASLDNADFARQAITYAYNKGVTWAVLTNFARLQIFNAEWETVDLGKARVLDLSFEDYPKADSDLVMLSREAVLDHQLEATAQKYGGMKARLPVEKNLFGQMRAWRASLFNDMARIRPDLSFEVLDEVIERLFNRLIFIRNCEDRAVEEALLRAALNHWRERGRVGLTVELQTIFRRFNDTFDSDLFAPHTLDELLSTVGTQLEAHLGEMVAGLYQPAKSLAAYDFSVLDADVLGAVYEQYLGYVAAVVKDRAKTREKQLVLGLEVERIALEQKRERRKEHGIYYTPKWIVRRIVNDAIVPALEQRASGPLTILDPACGSGSFLIQAFDLLMGREAEELGISPKDLSQSKRIKILTKSIYGVDLDSQAVDIARLNLLLRAVARRERLPVLEKNIVHGNTLISGSHAELSRYFGSDWMAKAPLDWGAAFPAVMKDGGFDVIVGNPPYLGFHGMNDADKAFLRDHYSTAIARFDLYVPFIERSLQLLKDDGYLGLICPTNFMKREHGKELRSLLSSETTILALDDFGSSQAFEGALNYTGVLIAKKRRPAARHKLRFARGHPATDVQQVDQQALTSAPWVFRSASEEVVVGRVEGQAVVPLGDLCVGIEEGIVTGRNEVFLLSEDDMPDGMEPGVVRRALRGRDIQRFHLELQGTRVIYPHVEMDGRTIPLAEEDFRAEFPRAYKHLADRRQQLKGRAYFERSNKQWYELWCPRSLAVQGARKIVTPELSDVGRFGIAPPDVLFLDTACGLSVKKSQPYSLEYLLGVLNSKLMEFYYRHTTVPKANGYMIYKTMFLRRIPILDAESSRRASGLVTKIEEEVAAILRAYERKRVVQGAEGRQVRDVILAAQDRVDELIYGLYGLNPIERELVERSNEGRKTETPTGG